MNNYGYLQGNAIAGKPEAKLIQRLLPLPPASYADSALLTLAIRSLWPFIVVLETLCLILLFAILYFILGLI